MSLWLTLSWCLFILAVLAAFILTRKRVADIARDVDEEFARRDERIRETERKADDRLAETLLEFGDISHAVETYQKTLAEMPGVPPARPAWNWSPTDLEALQRRRASEEKTARSRRTVVAAVLGVLGLAAIAAVVTVVLSSTISPVLANSTPQPGPPVPVYLPTAVPQRLPAMPAVSPDLGGGEAPISAPNAGNSMWAGPVPASSGTSASQGAPELLPAPSTQPAPVEETEDANRRTH